MKYLKELIPFLSPNGFFALDDSERYKIDIPNIKEITFFNSEFLNA